MNILLDESPDVSAVGKLWALTVSLIVVSLGVTWTWKVGQESNLLHHQAGETMDSVEGIRRILDAEGIAH